MTIVYALIARGRAVLAEYTHVHGNFPTVTRVLLAKIPSEPGRDETMSYVYDQHIFHYIVEDGITYLCMADGDAGKRRVPFAFLEDIKGRAKARFGSNLQSAIAFAFNQEFAPVLQRQMEFFNNDPSADHVSAVKTRLDDVRDVMVENIEKILERSERIELLVDKSENLNQQAFRFERSSRQLRRNMMLRRVRVYALAVLAVAGVIFIFVSAMCGGLNFKRCRG